MLPEKPAPPETSKREPLYELIGWKRNPPPVQLDLRGSKPFPLPTVPTRQPSPPPAPPPPEPVKADPDVWIPRQDWVPPAAAPPPPVRHPDKVWIRRPTLLVANNNSQNNNSPVIRKNQSIEENPIYGRLWETSSSPNNSSRSSSCSADAEEKPSNEADMTGKSTIISTTQFTSDSVRLNSFKTCVLCCSYSIDGQKSPTGALAIDRNVWYDVHRRRNCPAY